MQVTQRHIDLARQVNACNDVLCRLRVGMGVSVLRQEWICWAWQAGLILSSDVPEFADPAAVQLLGHSGDGSGDGSGYGYGHGHGHGYGDGHGNGYGLGYGDGHGSGDGHGYGDGNG